MTKSLDRLYDEVMASDELKKEYFAAAGEGKIAEFLAAHDCRATIEELNDFLASPKALPQGELCDDELDSVAGGTCYHGGRPVVTLYNTCDLWVCKHCHTSKELTPATYSFAGACPRCENTAFCDACEFYRYEDCLMLCYHPKRINN